MLQAFSQEQNEAIENQLMNLLVKAEANAVYLCDRGGNIMAQKSAQAYAGEDNIAALASGSFYATRVLAELLGEAEFRHAIHQGSKTSMYMQIMDCDLLVLVVFGQESNPGLVKLYCAEACHAIDDMFGHQPFNTTAMPQTGTVFELDASRNPFQRVG